MSSPTSNLTSSHVAASQLSSSLFSILLRRTWRRNWIPNTRPIPGGSSADTQNLPITDEPITHARPGSAKTSKFATDRTAPIQYSTIDGYVISIVTPIEHSTWYRPMKTLKSFTRSGTNSASRVVVFEPLFCFSRRRMSRISATSATASNTPTAICRTVQPSHSTHFAAFIECVLLQVVQSTPV